MCKLCKYVIIKDGVLCVLETDRMKEVIRNELGVFDYRDYIFDDDPSVYLLVKDLSVYDTNHTIIFLYDYDKNININYYDNDSECY